MNSFKSFEQKLFRLSATNFEELALKVFQYQALQNPVYHAYLSNLNINVDNVKTLAEIPFLPISLFKYHDIKIGDWMPEAVFKSSGTTGQIRSSHQVQRLDYYEKISESIFKDVYGPLEDYTFMALLPSYLDRNDSSLVHMVSHFIKKGTDLSGFYLNNTDELISNINQAQDNEEKIVLVGVSFALLDLAEKYHLDLNNVIIMETGGMKGRRKELVRRELHKILKEAFNVTAIHSEYGMTELLSQAYSTHDGRFYSPAWMRILLRDINDPFDLQTKKMGGINIIDLANINTCCFVETQDLGQVNADGSFEVLGRIDNTDLRGCNLLVMNN